MRALNGFIEMPGGVIIGPNGRDALRVAVDELTTAEAGRITRTVIAALNAEFGHEAETVEVTVDTRELGETVAQAVADKIKAALPGIVACGSRAR
ncbi:hypothetical protein [Falsigemmobacter faecalis]|uniref:Uncharacterized protein n=1 Tax=Falsigemmobacter faecalis TaxID=2488730 RepID=A0A3P3DCE1_9RHOB|nr:hypothetical protein [Falsigemmobacter faecalis]RRH72007.1 hypothetical protein EG244_15955 [Falsigemmobacter faecalis]